MICVRKSLLLLPIILIFLLLASCNDPDGVGLGVLPDGEQPGIGDTTFGLVTHTVKEDSVISSSLYSPFFLGSMNDPETGKTYASFYTQVVLHDGNTITSTTFDNVTTPDSVLLSLGYVGDPVYGAPFNNRENKHHISVYQMSDTMQKGTTYYSFRDFSLDKMIGHADVLIRPNDSIKIRGVKKAPQLVISLDTSFGGGLMRDFRGDNAALISNYLKGIYLVDSVDGIGNIVMLNPASALNRITLYYHNDTGSVNIGRVYYNYELEINNTCARSLRFKHDYDNCTTTRDVGAYSQLCGNDTLNGQTYTFIQSLGGLKTKINLPDWNVVFKNKKASISHADLTVSIKKNSDLGLFKPHTSLLLMGTTSSGKYFLIDGGNNPGGGYNSVSKTYSFNITLYLQRILIGTVKDYGLYLVSGSILSEFKIPDNPRRTVLNGGSSMKLKINYTLQNN